MENLFGSLSGLKQFVLFGSCVWAAIIVGIFLILLFVSESEEQGFIGFGSLLGLCVLNYFFGNLPLLKLISVLNVSVYLSTGLFFTIIRVFFYGRKLKLDGNEFSKVYLKDNVFRWWFMWPISLLSWIFSDLIGDFWAVIYDKLSNLFEDILKFGYNSVKKD